MVHCAAGVSRSAMLVCGYLMSRPRLTLDQSLTQLRYVRPWVSPNPGFMAQLREYERLGCDSSKWMGWSSVCKGGEGLQEGYGGSGSGVDDCSQQRCQLQQTCRVVVRQCENT